MVVRRRLSTEVALNAVAVVVVPFLAGPVLAQLNWPMRALGLGGAMDLLAGRPYFSDIGMEVAAAYGLVSPTHTMYESMTVLGPLMGLVGFTDDPHTHPPTSMVPWIPLTWIPYSAWLPFFAVLSVCVIAASMRLLDVPAWVAYPVAIAVGLHPDWLFGMVSTYPLTALAIAIAWRFRDRSGVSGAMYGLLGAARGFAGVLVLYPLIRRQWRTVAVAAAVVLGLLAIAVVIEPSSISDFVRTGTATVDKMLVRPDLFTVSGWAVRHGLPSWLGLLPAAAGAAVMLARRNDLFWVLVWFSLAASSLAWMQTTIVLIPLAVMIYRTGVLGRVIVLLGIGVILGPLSAGVVSLNVIWPAAILLTGVALVVSPARFDEGVWPNRTTTTTPGPADAFSSDSALA